MDRDEVVRILREIAVLLRARGESEFRARAYETGASRIAQVQGDLREMVRKKALTQIPGIGGGLAATITDLVEKGQSKTYDSLREGFPPGIGELLQIPGLGAKKALALWSALGVGTVDELELACVQGKVRAVKGFGPKGEQKLLEGITEWRRVPEVPDRRRLGDVVPPAEALLQELTASGRVRRGVLAGDARRAVEEVDAPELVLVGDSPEAVHAALSASPLVARVSDRETGGWSLRLFDREVTLGARAVSNDAFVAALVDSTGSAAHVAKLQALAVERGFRLAPEGLFTAKGKPVALEDEEALYAKLGLPWIAPELREDSGEIDAALDGRIPSDLLQPADVAGVVHSHSTWSDGTASIEEMARAARELGYRFLTVTDHSQTASYAGGLKLDDLRRQWDEVDALNDKLEGIRLLKGIETDILEDGSLDYPDAILEKLEVVIGSIHSRHQMNERQMTDRILRAFDNPHLHILGHATGRLIQRRDPYALRMEEILDKAAEKGVAIEVNGSPHRLDLKADYVRMGLKRGVKLVVSADSHSTREIQYMRYAVLTARRGWARRVDVLNTLDADAFTARLRANRR